MDYRRNLVRVEIDGELLATMLQGDGEIHYRLGGEIPVDAVFLNIINDYLCNRVNLIFEHPSFPVCELGDFPVIRPVSLTRIDDRGVVVT